MMNRTEGGAATPDPEPRVIAVVQARMTSRRLPGKVLTPLAGSPVLGLVVARLGRATRIDEIVVATSTDPSDDPVAEWCAENGTRCHRGSLDDVLDRFLGAARASGATHVVRITADCPLIDPDLVDRVIAQALAEDLDYCGLAGEFPDGLDCEVMTRSALERAAAEAMLPSEREHVTPYLKRPDGTLRRGEVRPFVGLGHHRWTLDRPEDLRFLEAVLARSSKDALSVTTEDILAILEAGPDLMAMNAGIVRNEGYLRSLGQDGAP